MTKLPSLVRLWGSDPGYLSVVQLVCVVGSDHGGKVALELNIGSARSGRVVLAGEASGQVLEDLFIVQVRDRA